MKTSYEDKFKQLIEESNGKDSILLGTITEGMKYPQVGVTGNVTEILVILASAIRQVANNMNASAEGLLSVIYEMIQDIEELEEGMKS